MIMTGQMDHWQAMARWTPQALAERFGEVEVEVQADRSADAEYELNSGKHKKTVRFGDFVAQVLRGGESNDYYMVANNRALERESFKELLGDFDFSRFGTPATPSGR